MIEEQVDGYHSFEEGYHSFVAKGVGVVAKVARA
jgi:hypothetical protein